MLTVPLPQTVVSSTMRPSTEVMMNSGTNRSVNRVANVLRSKNAPLPARSQTSSRADPGPNGHELLGFRILGTEAEQELLPLVKQSVLVGHAPPIGVDLRCQVGILKLDGQRVEPSVLRKAAGAGSGVDDATARRFRGRVPAGRPVSAKRGDRAAPPPRAGGYALRFTSNDAAKGWEELCRQAAANTRAAFDAIEADPLPRSAGQSTAPTLLRPGHALPTLRGWHPGPSKTYGARSWLMLARSSGPSEESRSGSRWSVTPSFLSARSIPCTCHRSG